MDTEPVYEFLDPGRVWLDWDACSRLRLTIEGDRSYWDVRAALAFPVGEPDRYVALLDRCDKVIGVVSDPQGLSPESRTVLREAIQSRYLAPVVKRIHSIKRECGAVYLDVDTDRGRRVFVVQGLRESVEELGESGLLLTDTDGNRYRVLDWRKLDKRSRRAMEQIA